MTVIKQTISSGWELEVRRKVVIEQKDLKDKASTGSGEGTDMEAGAEAGVETGDATDTARDPGVKVTIDNTNIVIAHVRDIGTGRDQEIVTIGARKDTKSNVREVRSETHTAEIIAIVHGHPGQAETRAERPDE